MLFQHTVDKKLAAWLEALRTKADLPVRVQRWDGQQFDLGHFSHPKVTIQVKDEHAVPLLLAPSLNNLAEAYVHGKIDIEGELEDVIAAGYQLAHVLHDPKIRLTRLVRHFLHSKEEDRKAIEYHYDVSNDFYQLWLDTNMVYSCAYFEQGTEDLETAQLKKIDHILTKIQLKPGETLLDIGCGWGALVLRAAQQYDARCLGITLSSNQFQLANERVAAAGLSKQIEIRLQDYRDVDGRFDRITSVGMFEHVGRKNLPTYFHRIAQLLKPGGLAMNHGITSTDADSGEAALGGGDFIDKYVFPQGELPHISLVLQSMQRGGLEALDAENLRRHYAHTLRHWAQRFEAHAAQVRGLAGEKRYRIWRLYLAGCAHAFAIDQIALFQVICQHANQSADHLPWSRRYIYP